MCIRDRHLLTYVFIFVCKKEEHANIHFWVFVFINFIHVCPPHHNYGTYHTYVILSATILLFVVGPGFRLSVNIDWNGLWNKDTNISQILTINFGLFSFSFYTGFYYSTMASWTTKTEMAAVTYISYSLITTTRLYIFHLSNYHFSLLIGQLPFY